MDINDRLKAFDKKIETRLAEAEKRLAGRLGEADRDSLERSDSTDEPSLVRPKASSLDPGVRPRGSISLVNDSEMLGLFLPRPSEVQQAMAFVRHAPRIADNVLYSQRAESTSFYYANEEDVVNAFATDSPVKLDDEHTLQPPAVLFFGGLARALCLASTALALQRVVRVRRHSGASMDFVRGAIERIGQAVVASSGNLSAKSAEEVFREVLLEHIISTAPGAISPKDEDEGHIELAKSLRSSMYMFVVGHEIGHIAYGHTLGSSVSFEVSRRQEFDADSFALQALIESPFSEYTFLGQVFVTLIFAWVGHATGDKVASTHPMAADRFRALFKDPDSRVARQMTSEFGLTQAALESLLPPAS